MDGLCRRDWRHSAALTKRWYPRGHYFGVDRDAYNNAAEDFALMERLYSADLETSDLADNADGAFERSCAPTWSNTCAGAWQCWAGYARSCGLPASCT